MENKTENYSVPDCFRKPASYLTGGGLALFTLYTCMAFDRFLHGDVTWASIWLVSATPIAWATLAFSDTARLAGAPKDDPFPYRPTTIEFTVGMFESAKKHFPVA
ncbi:MAG: hypothetical protein WC464_06970 [Bdellovibrionales bacterium]